MKQNNLNLKFYMTGRKIDQHWADEEDNELADSTPEGVVVHEDGTRQWVEGDEVVYEMPEDLTRDFENNWKTQYTVDLLEANPGDPFVLFNKGEIPHIYYVGEDFESQSFLGAMMKNNLLSATKEGILELFERLKEWKESGVDPIRFQYVMEYWLLRLRQLHAGDIGLMMKVYSDFFREGRSKKSVLNYYEPNGNFEESIKVIRERCFDFSLLLPDYFFKSDIRGDGFWTVFAFAEVLSHPDDFKRSLESVGEIEREDPFLFKGNHPLLLFVNLFQREGIDAYLANGLEEKDFQGDSHDSQTYHDEIEAKIAESRNYQLFSVYKTELKAVIEDCKRFKEMMEDFFGGEDFDFSRDDFRDYFLEQKEEFGNVLGVNWDLYFGVLCKIFKNDSNGSVKEGGAQEVVNDLLKRHEILRRVRGVKKGLTNLVDGEVSSKKQNLRARLVSEYMGEESLMADNRIQKYELGYLAVQEMMEMLSFVSPQKVKDVVDEFLDLYVESDPQGFTFCQFAEFLVADEDLSPGLRRIFKDKMSKDAAFLEKICLFISSNNPMSAALACNLLGEWVGRKRDRLARVIEQMLPNMEAFADELNAKRLVVLGMFLKDEMLGVLKQTLLQRKDVWQQVLNHLGFYGFDDYSSRSDVRVNFPALNIFKEEELVGMAGEELGYRRLSQQFKAELGGVKVPSDFDENWAVKEIMTKTTMTFSDANDVRRIPMEEEVWPHSLRKSLTVTLEPGESMKLGEWTMKLRLFAEKEEEEVHHELLELKFRKGGAEMEIEEKRHTKFKSKFVENIRKLGVYLAHKYLFVRQQEGSEPKVFMDAFGDQIDEVLNAEADNREGVSEQEQEPLNLIDLVAHGKVNKQIRLSRPRDDKPIVVDFTKEVKMANKEFSRKMMALYKGTRAKLKSFAAGKEVDGDIVLYRKIPMMLSDGDLVEVATDKVKFMGDRVRLIPKKLSADEVSEILEGDDVWEKEDVFVMKKSCFVRNAGYRKSSPKSVGDLGLGLVTASVGTEFAEMAFNLHQDADGLPPLSDFRGSIPGTMKMKEALSSVELKDGEYQFSPEVEIAARFKGLMWRNGKEDSGAAELLQGAKNLVERSQLLIARFNDLISTIAVAEAGVLNSDIQKLVRFFWEQPEYLGLGRVLMYLQRFVGDEAEVMKVENVEELKIYFVSLMTDIIADQNRFIREFSLQIADSFEEKTNEILEEETVELRERISKFESMSEVEFRAWFMASDRGEEIVSLIEDLQIREAELNRKIDMLNEGGVDGRKADIGERVERLEEVIEELDELIDNEYEDYILLRNGVDILDEMEFAESVEGQFALFENVVRDYEVQLREMYQGKQTWNYIVRIQKGNVNLKEFQKKYLPIIDEVLGDLKEYCMGKMDGAFQEVHAWRMEKQAAKNQIRKLNKDWELLAAANSVPLRVKSLQEEVDNCRSQARAFRKALRLNKERVESFKLMDNEGVKFEQEKMVENLRGELNEKESMLGELPSLVDQMMENTGLDLMFEEGGADSPDGVRQLVAARLRTLFLVNKASTFVSGSFQSLKEFKEELEVD